MDDNQTQTTPEIEKDLATTEETDIPDESVEGDKVGEYFQIKETVKTLKDDLKELKEQHESFEELNELNKKIKELRLKVKNDENIKVVEEKIATLKERMELIKEIIKAELIENAQEEVKQDGRKLKLVQVLKEMKDEEGK